MLTAQLVRPPAALAVGATYCVGNQAQAPAECVRVFRTLDDASRLNYVAGDTLKLEGGTTFRGPLWFDPGESGTAADPITITSYGTGRARIETTTQPAKAGVDIYDAQGFRVSNLDLQGAGATTSTTGGVQFFNDL